MASAYFFLINFAFHTASRYFSTCRARQQSQSATDLRKEGKTKERNKERKEEREGGWSSVLSQSSGRYFWDIDRITRETRVKYRWQEEQGRQQKQIHKTRWIFVALAVRLNIQHNETGFRWINLSNKDEEEGDAGR